ncbi:MAG: transpeptidase family protein [Candidatus Sumerlaeia bacterium]|nr:transpeptidase family protein [Candidatus Sumerlaeia bacterium]
MKLRKPHRLRVILFGLGFSLLTGVVGWRLYDLQYLRHERFSERSEAMHYRHLVIQPERGEILDRTGRPLAQSTGRTTVYINPSLFRAPTFKGNLEELARLIGGEIGEDPSTIMARFEASGTTRLARRVRPNIGERILRHLATNGADSRGYWIHRETIRLYPARIAGPVIGFCTTDADGDNIGIAGLELHYNDILNGQKIVSRSPRTAMRETMRAWQQQDLYDARGHSLKLTIDAGLQEVVEEVLEKTVAKFRADAAGAVVMDPNTGAILAMGSYPTFDNNNFGSANTEARRPRTITDPFETGSVAKLFTAAQLVDLGITNPDTLVDCEGGTAVVDRRRLRDSGNHNLGVVPFRVAMRHSSNVGIVKLAQDLENQEWFDFLRSLRFGQPTGIDLPGEGSGILYPVERWTRFSRTSLPMGYEMGLTALQSTAAIAAIVNGGIYREPYLVEEIRDSRGNIVTRHDSSEGHRVIRPTSSIIMRDLMEDVVLHGSGKPGQVPGYRVGGKTGTTRKSDIFDRREYIASFAGAVPIDNPRLVVYVYVDAPRTAYYASMVAAPAFREITQAALLSLGIPPSDGTIPSHPGKNVLELVQTGDESLRGFPDLIESGTMPDFRGMTMRQARGLLPTDLQKVRFVGSGFVADQYPAPGERLNEQTEVVLHFSPRGTIDKPASGVAGVAR